MRVLSRLLIRNDVRKIADILIRKYYNVQKPRWTTLDRIKSRINRFDEKNVLYAIIGANSLVYGMWQFSKSNWKNHGFMFDNFTISSFGVFQKYKVHTLLTSFFSHTHLMHLAVNMFTLWVFAPVTMATLSVTNFLALYIGGGIISNICYVIWPYVIPRSFPASYRSSSKFNTGLGASGAISAVVIYSILYNPSQILWLYFIIPVPAAICGVAFISYDLYELYRGGSKSGNAAHLGGAAFGMLYYLSKRFRYRIGR